MTTDMCPQCRRHLVQIDLRLADQSLTMRACSACDTRSWHRDGRRVDLGTVLSRASAGT